MINLLRSAPCKTISLLPTIKAKSICAKYVKARNIFYFMHCMSMYITAASLSLTTGQLLHVSSLEPSHWPQPLTLDLLSMCCQPCTTAGGTNVLVFKEELVDAFFWAFGLDSISLILVTAVSHLLKHHLFTLNLLESVKANPFQPTIWKWSWTQRPKKQVTNTTLF